jgi:hypothetical protein
MSQRLDGQRDHEAVACGGMFASGTKKSSHRNLACQEKKSWLK